MMWSHLPSLILTVLLLTVHGCTHAQPKPADPAHWVSTWSAPPDGAGPPLQAQTIRQIVRASAGGSQVRVRLSNQFGTTPLTLGAVHVAAHAGAGAIQPGSSRALRFNGAPSVTIAPGASALSDAAEMKVAPLQELAVSLYLPAGAQNSTIHGAGMQTAYLAPGERSGAPSWPPGATDDSRYFVTDVEVAGAPGTGVIVVVGDSIADGVGSTQDAHARWPDVLAQMLHDGPVAPFTAVVNAGIAGNRLLKDGARPFVGPATLARFERDALAKPGVRAIVLAQGINDIVASDMLTDPAQGASAEQIIEGMRSLIERAHARGIRIAGATLLPLGGVGRPFVYSPAAEAKRQAVNAWMRAGGQFDGVLDADALLRDPRQPERLLARFDSGDHLHPNDAGYREIARAAHALWTQLGTAAEKKNEQ